MYKTYAMYDKVDDYLLHTGVTVKARTLGEAMNEGSKHRTGKYCGFVMVEEEA